MMRILQAIIAIIVVATYLLLLRYVAPPNEPYFFLATGVVGLVALLCGRVAGLVIAMLLIPTLDAVYAQFEISTNYSKFYMSPAFIAVQIIAALGLGILRRHIKDLSIKRADLLEVNAQLQGKLANVQDPGGIHSLCSKCKDIQDEDGRWEAIEVFLTKKTKMEFSHALCPKCAENFYAAAEKPAAEKPAVEKPAADKPAAEKSTDES